MNSSLNNFTPQETNFCQGPGTLCKGNVQDAQTVSENLFSAEIFVHVGQGGSSWTPLLPLAGYPTSLACDNILDAGN